MKEYVLDTHAFVWWAMRPKRLGRTAARVLPEVDAGRARAFLPSIVGVELALLAEAGRRLIGVAEIEAATKRNDGVRVLAQDLAQVTEFALLGALADPFDRMIVAAARASERRQPRVGPVRRKVHRFVQYPNDLYGAARLVETVQEEVARRTSALADVQKARLWRETGSVMPQSWKLLETAARIGKQRPVLRNLRRTKLNPRHAKDFANVGLRHFGEDDAHGLLGSRVVFTLVEERLELRFGLELGSAFLEGLDAGIPCRA